LNTVQATPGKLANASRDRQHTPPEEVLQSDNVLNEVELEVIWLGEESIYCLSCHEFQFDSIYASPALKVEVHKLSQDDQSETEKLKQTVRLDERLVSRLFDFVRKYIRKKSAGGSAVSELEQ
jgi:hypothetical protein